MYMTYKHRNIGQRGLTTSLTTSIRSFPNSFFHRLIHSRQCNFTVKHLDIIYRYRRYRCFGREIDLTKWRLMKNFENNLKM